MLRQAAPSSLRRRRGLLDFAFRRRDPHPLPRPCTALGTWNLLAWPFPTHRARVPRLRSWSPRPLPLAGASSLLALGPCSLALPDASRVARRFAGAAYSPSLFAGATLTPCRVRAQPLALGPCSFGPSRRHQASGGTGVFSISRPSSRAASSEMPWVQWRLKRLARYSSKLIHWPSHCTRCVHAQTLIKPSR